MKFSLFKKLQNISIILIFIVTAIFVCAITGLIKLNPFFIDTLGLIIILCTACILSLTWIKYLEEKKYKILSIVFLVSIIICSILWAVCLIIIVNTISNDKNISIGILYLIKISLLLSIQFLVASSCTSITLKYKKSMLPFQIITYISYIFIDIYFSTLIISLDKNINFESVADVLFSKVMLTFIIIALIFVMISNSIVKRIDKRKINEITNSVDENNQLNSESQTEIQEISISDKFVQLKQLFESDLITKEEYEKKKAELLDKM